MEIKQCILETTNKPKKISKDKLESILRQMKTNEKILKLIGCSKSNTKREVYSNNCLY